ncbi:universal stress protein [Pseudidiomarina mangrovi]|uniref:universal stress protein n=1 Tax=Pseudidiomarina mangrovi TaxID=2487133 RepID=UPI000FC9D7C6|nr:universal stress protein [Pseudidiomarina mangrovi]
MSQIISCIDDVSCHQAVCEYSAWAARQLSAPVMALHVLDDMPQPQQSELSGNIGLGSREQLLQQLADLDAARSKIALQHGHVLLDQAADKLRSLGVAEVSQKLRHGELAETLLAMENDVRLAVLGLHGEHSANALTQVGGQLETVIRTVHRPLLLTPADYQEPRSAMLAFDNSATAIKGVELLAKSPLFQGMPVHVVMVDADTAANWERLKWAQSLLEAGGHEAHIALRAGAVEQTLHAYQAEHNIDLMVMGAFGHSRIRQFLVGSTTMSMLKSSRTPTLVLR